MLLIFTPFVDVTRRLFLSTISGSWLPLGDDNNNTHTAAAHGHTIDTHTQRLPYFLARWLAAAAAECTPDVLRLLVGVLRERVGFCCVSLCRVCKQPADLLSVCQSRLSTDAKQVGFFPHSGGCVGLYMYACLTKLSGQAGVRAGQGGHTVRIAVCVCMEGMYVSCVWHFLPSAAGATRGCGGGVGDALVCLV